MVAAQTHDLEIDMSIVWLPLQGEGGERPKAPAVAGWQSPSYQGVDPEKFDGWMGLRTDGLVVIDCDGEESAEFWQKHVGPKGIVGTWVRKTPRGFHYIYPADSSSPTGPDVDIFKGQPPGIDLRVTNKSQIVFRAPGYKTIVRNDLSELYVIGEP